MKTIDMMESYDRAAFDAATWDNAAAPCPRPDVARRVGLLGRLSSGIRSECWCPEEDSNFHDLAATGT